MATRERTKEQLYNQAKRPSRFSEIRSRRMSKLLAVDVGNTQTVFGLYEDGRLDEHWRVATEAHRTGDELGALGGRQGASRRALHRRRLRHLDQLRRRLG